MVVRWQFVDFQSGDYRAFLDRWYAYLAENGGFAVLKDGSFSNYNTPYLALLAVTTYLPVPQIVAIKASSVIFDVALAAFAYKIIGALRPGARWLPTLAFGVVIMLPTVIMNSSVWAQCDAIYVTFCAGSVYFLIKRRPWLATAFFGIAFAFKLQAIFFLPVLVLVLIINRHRLRSLVAAPAAFLACLTPALIAGRSLASQLSVYPAQIANPSGAGGGGGTGGPVAGVGCRAALAEGVVVAASASLRPSRTPTMLRRRSHGCRPMRRRCGRTPDSSWPLPSHWPSASGCWPVAPG
jgi:Gpi18-like mannosyltransferase